MRISGDQYGAKFRDIFEIINLSRNFDAEL